jgi:hypothetical protein
MDGICLGKTLYQMFINLLQKITTIIRHTSKQLFQVFLFALCPRILDSDVK